MLKALIQYAKNSTYWLAERNVAEQIEKIVLRESKRNNPAFRQHALECLADFVEMRKDADNFSQTHAVVTPIIEEFLDNSDEMDVDSKSGGQSSKSVMEATLANSATALLNSVNPSTTDTKDLCSRLTQVLELLNRIRNETRSRKAIEAIYDAEKQLFEKIDKAQQGPLTGSIEEILIEYAKQIFSSTDHVEMTRIKAAEAAVAMASIVRRGEKIKAVFNQGLAAARESERSPSVQQSLDRARKVLDG